MNLGRILESAQVKCVVIPLLPQNPNFFMGYDAEIV